MTQSPRIPFRSFLRPVVAVALVGLFGSGCALLNLASSAAAKDDYDPNKERVARGPTEPVSFPEAESMMEPLLADHAKSVGSPPPKLMRVYLADGDWSMVRNDFGTITARRVDARVYYQGGETRKCMSWSCVMSQEEQGGSWGAAKLRCDQDGDYTSDKPVATKYTCDSVAALPGAPPESQG